MASNQPWAPPETDFTQPWSPPAADFAAPGAANATAAPTNTAPLGAGPYPAAMTDPTASSADTGAAAAAYAAKLHQDAQTTGGDIAPTTDPSENFVRGAGNSVVNTTNGIRQIAMEIGNHLGLVSDEGLQQEQSAIDAQKQAEAPLLATTSGKAGDIAGQAAQYAALPGAGIIGSAAEGAVMGAAQPVVSGQSRFTNATLGAVGGAGGAATGKVISGVLGGFGGAGGRQAAVDLLGSEGVPLSTAQVTGSKIAQQAERASAMTSDAPAEFSAEQGQAFNRAVLRRIGVTDPTVTAATPEVLAPAKAAITDVMNGVSARTTPKADDAFISDLADIEHSATRQIPDSDRGPITQNINDILDNASENNGYLDGTFVQKLNSNLGALSRNPATAPVAADLQEAVHNVVQRYASPDDAAALRVAQQQFRALKQIEPAVDPTTGNISVPKLMSSLNSKNYGGRNQVLYARGDQSLVDLARAARQVIPDNLGNSGTGERTLPALSALEVAASGHPVEAGTKALIGWGALNTAGSALRNQGALGSYLRSGIPGARAAAPIIKSAAPALGYGAAENMSPTFASGGRVDHDALTAQLIGRWKAAKKASSKTTEPLLDFPDAAITRALTLAAQHR